MSNQRELRICLRNVALALIAPYIFVGCADKSSRGPTTAVAPAATQDDAVRQAKKTDLPTLSNADRAVLSSAQPPMGTGQSIEITDTNRIRRLTDTLKPAALPPSGGVDVMTVRFYQGPTLLREVWVFQDGEWGFRRPGTSFTTGRSGELVRLIQQELAGDPAAR